MLWPTNAGHTRQLRQEVLHHVSVEGFDHAIAIRWLEKSKPEFHAPCRCLHSRFETEARSKWLGLEAQQASIKVVASCKAATR